LGFTIAAAVAPPPLEDPGRTTEATNQAAPLRFTPTPDWSRPCCEVTERGGGGGGGRSLADDSGSGAK